MTLSVPAPDAVVTALPRREPSRPALADVDRALADTFAREARVLAEVGDELDGLVEAATDLASGGKRLRAAFVLWAAEASAPDGRAPGVVDAAAALELFHLGALVHDDVMDRSDLRRGRPTAHRRFASQHHDDRLTGDADQYGDAVATLLGDLCFSWADDLLDRAVERAGDRGPATRRAWERMRTETMAGQYLDLLAQARGHVPDELATRVLRFKSASYTVEHPLVLGGTLGGASADLLEHYAVLGRLVGEAFQLRDDVLGVFGRPDETGKPACDDVREGKRTVLVAYAEETATAAELATLHHHLGNPDVDDAGCDAVREVLVDTGALSRVESRIGALAESAQDALSALPVPTASRRALRDLVGASVWRAA
jgi:geranylgeranyl diphosphate synthase, type I